MLLRVLKASADPSGTPVYTVIFEQTAPSRLPNNPATPC
uniref:Uncharacterized protein n=1 Tax=Plectus sambesii TaxID=2011161 RepID=A0A914W1Z0_9BILA